MSLPKLDHRMPITVPVVAIHPVTRQKRVVHVDVLWSHVIAIEDEPFPEQYAEIIEQYGGVCTLRFLWGCSLVAGRFNEYHAHWSAYKAICIKQEDKYKFNIPAN